MTTKTVLLLFRILQVIVAGAIFFVAYKNGWFKFLQKTNTDEEREGIGKDEDGSES